MTLAEYYVNNHFLTICWQKHISYFIFQFPTRDKQSTALVTNYLQNIAQLALSIRGMQGVIH